MKRRILTALVGIITITFLTSPTISRARNGYIDQSALFESEEVEIEELYTTAYMCGHHTALGVPVHVGCAACNPRLGYVGVIYSLDGEYLMTVEVNDTGNTQGLQNGSVIDCYFPTYEECKAWMAKTGGRIKVVWIKGEG